MSFAIDTTATCYFLPDDGAEAEQRFLDDLKNPYETYLVAYGFTLEAMVEEILAAHEAGTVLHLYLDHSQSTGAAERGQVRRLVDAGVEVTIGTSPAGSGYICHTKGMVVLDPSGPVCWTGSVNFSQSGWKQVNDAMTFSNQQWADGFIARFKAMRGFAWKYEPHMQLMAQEPKQ